MTVLRVFAFLSDLESFSRCPQEFIDQLTGNANHEPAKKEREQNFQKLDAQIDGTVDGCGFGKEAKP